MVLRAEGARSGYGEVGNTLTGVPGCKTLACPNTNIYIVAYDNSMYL